MKFILCDHWTLPPDGWSVLKEEDQDITKRFPWEDNSVDVLFSCHGIEHVDLMGGINYMQEAFRVLKPGGVLRTVCPMADKLIQFEGHDEVDKNYVKTSLEIYYPGESIALRELGITFTDHGLPFLLDSLLKKHLHKFVWSSDLMVRVLESIGFSEVTVPQIGESFFDESNCLERKVRGIDTSVLEESVYQYDCESLVVEARK